MLRDRGIRKGIEVFVKNVEDPGEPDRKALVVNTYPHPSSWMVVRYENGDKEFVDEWRVTTMFEKNRRMFY